MKISDELIDEQIFLDQENQKHQNEKHPSQFLVNYLQFFSKTFQQFRGQASQKLRLLQNFIVLDINQPFRKDISVRIINASKNCQFIDIEVTLGNFIFPKLSIMNTQVFSPTHYLHHQKKGNYGKVYRAYCYQEQIAIKCCQYSKKNFSKLLSNVLTEYCLTRLCSFLGGGPYFSDKMGYHIIVYKDCIQFSMEYCEQIAFGFNFLPEGQQQLKESLKKFHLVNLVHVDIKHENICFSPHFKQFIFIDFGLSLISSEDLGFRSLTGFAGTHYYCSQQMKRLQKSGEGFVDLYYNDVACLDKVFSTQRNNIQQIDFSSQGKLRRNLFEKIQNITSFHVKYLIKFQLFNLEIKRAQNTLKIFSRHFSNLQIQQMKDQIQNMLEKDLKNDFRQQITDGIGDNSERKSLIIQNINEMNIINSSLKLDSSIECKDYERNILLQKEQGDYKVSFKQLQSYFKILSKAIKINSAKYSVQQKRLFCIKAIKVLQSLNLINKIQLKGRQFFSQIKFISRYLLQYCFNPISPAKYSIFCTAIINVIILKTFSSNQIINYLKLVVSSNIQDFTKLKMIFQFFKSHSWLFFISNQYKDYQRCKKNMVGLIQEYLKKPNQMNQISAYMWSIFSQQPFQSKKQYYVQSRMKEKHLVQQIKLFHLFEKSKKKFQDLLLIQKSEDNFFSQQLTRLVKRSYKSFNFCIQYYHLLTMMINFQQKRIPQFNKLFHQYSQIFPKECITFFGLQLIQKTLNMQIMITISHIQDFNRLLVEYKGAVVNKYFSRIIIFILRRIIIQQYSLFIFSSNYCRDNIFQTFFHYNQNQPSWQNSFSFQIQEQMEKVANIILFKNYFHIKISEENYNMLEVIFQSTFKQSYCHIRKKICENVEAKDYFLLLSMQLSLLFFKQKRLEFMNLCKRSLLVAKVLPNTPYLFYEHINHLINIDPQFKTRRHYIQAQLYAIYISLLDKNNQLFIIFKKKRMFYYIFEYMYQCSSATTISLFINKVSKALFQQQNQQCTASQIQIFTFYAWHSFKDTKLFHNFMAKSAQVADQLQPISSNPYNALPFYRFMFLKIVKPNLSLFISIFKSFSAINLTAKKYISKIIYQNFLDFSFPKLAKRKIKHLLIIIVKQSEFNIRRATFIKLLCKKSPNYSIHTRQIKNKLNCIFKMEFSPSLQINAHRSHNQTFEFYVKSYIQYILQAL